jgi:hypothetical protein
MFKMHNIRIRVMLKFVPGLAVSVGVVAGGAVPVDSVAVPVGGVVVPVSGVVVPVSGVVVPVGVVGREVVLVGGAGVPSFTKVNVPKLLTGLSPLREPSVSFVMR